MMREFLIRGLYCEMLGQAVPFVYIHALNMTQSPRLLDKRVGYLCTSIFLNDNHELLLLLLNSVRKDLDSTNILEVSAALSCMSWLLNRDTVYAILPLIIEKTKSQNELVRKKAVILLLRCLQKDVAATWGEVENVLRAKLCDTDPSVMAASLHCFSYVIELKHSDPVTYSYLPTLADLVPSFVGILKQLIEKRLPSHYNYHTVHGPWIQISLLRILRYLGMIEPSSVMHMSQVLKLILTSPADRMASCAIVNEAIRTICAFSSPDRQLLDLSARNIALFLGATSQDLNYLGLTLLAKIVSINPAYATEHQAHVISCLENPDETIRIKTIELLYYMTNSRNLVVIVGKMLDHLKKTTDVFLRTELVTKITTLAEKFSTDNYWFITTMNDVFLTAGEQVPLDVAHKFLRYIAEGATDDESVNEDLRIHAVTAYMQLAANPQLSEILQMVMAWVIGEYGYLVANPLEAVNALADLLDRPPTQKQNSYATQFTQTTSSGASSSLQSLESFSAYYGSEVKQWIVTALAKLAASVGTFPLHIRETFVKLTGSDNTELARRCQDYLLVIDSAKTSGNAAVTPGTIDLLNGASPHSAPTASILNDIFPTDAAAEDLVPSQLLGAAIDAHVKSALASGARAYSRPVERSLLQTRTPKEDKALRWKAYEKPVEPARFVPSISATSAPMTPQHTYNPLMTVREGSAPGSPMGTPTSTNISAPVSLASMSSHNGPWSSSGFGRQSPASPASIATPPPTFPQNTTQTASHSPHHLSTSTPSAAPRPELETYKPRLDANQARLANALFSGVGETGPQSHSPLSTNITSTHLQTGPRRRPDHKTTARTHPNELAPTGGSGSAAVGNLLDIPSSSSQDVSSFTSTQLTNRHPVDLLGLDHVSITPPVPQTSPPNTDLLGMDISGSHPSLHTSPQRASSASPTMHTGSPAQEVMQFTEPSTIAYNVNGGQLQQLSPDKDNWNLSNFSKSNLVATFLEPFPKPSQNSVPLSNDPFVCVSYLKAWTGEGLNIALFFGNRTSLKITRVSTSLALTQPLQTDVETDNTVQLQSSSSETAFDLMTNEIAPHVASACVVKVNIEDKLTLNMSLSGSTSFEVHGQPKNLKYRIPIDFRDLVRPTTRLNVNQFGAEWTSEAMREVKARSSGNASFASTAELATAVSEHNFGIVQVGKAEAVAACTLLSMRDATPQILLLHLKLDFATKAVDFTFRAHSHSLAEIASRYFSVVFG